MTAVGVARTLLFTPVEMAAADRATIEAGTSGWDLMLVAGRAVAQSVFDTVPSGARVLVLAGPGNNGGDGYVAGRVLRDAGCSVTILALGDPLTLSGDAALARDFWAGDIGSLDRASGGVASADVIIDAIFGAGLTRDVDGPARMALDAADRAEAPIIAVDVPSGLCGLTGAVRGFAPRCATTVTFHARKRGHVLQPGRTLCGFLRVADIGLDPHAPGFPSPAVHVNDPSLWRPTPMPPVRETHKYRHGHVGVVTGPGRATGAGRLAASAASHGGAGLVSLLSPASATLVNAAHETATMVKPFRSSPELPAVVADAKMDTLVCGPALGLENAETLYALLSSDLAAKGFVLDADALTLLAKAPVHLQMLPSNTVLTPHEGEFTRLFPDLAGRDKVARAADAASRSGAIVVLKGSDTVIATPEGRAVINESAPGWLAKAGAGDVLAGLIAAGMAQGLAPFDAACAAAWHHGTAAGELGPGLQPERLAERAGTSLARIFWEDRAATAALS